MASTTTLNKLQIYILNDALDRPQVPVMLRERMKGFWGLRVSMTRRDMGVMTGAQRVQLYRAWNELVRRRLIKPVTIRGKKKTQHVLTQKGYQLLCNASHAGAIRVTFKQYEQRLASWVEGYKDFLTPIKLDPEQKRQVEFRRRTREVRRERRRKQKELIERERKKKLKASVHEFQTTHLKKTTWLHFSPSSELEYLRKKLPNSRLIKNEIERRKTLSQK